MTNFEAPAHPLAPGEHFADINGNTIRYTVRGTGPVLLLPSPGWGPSVDYLIPIPALEMHCTVVYYDTRHSGRSTGPEDASQYGLDYLVSDMEALRSHLGAERVFVAGHSAGARQALTFGLRHSDRVLGIIAISAMVCADAVRWEERARRIAARQHEPFYRDHPDYYSRAVPLLMGQGPQLSIKETFLATNAFYYHNPELGFGESTIAPDYNDQLLAYSRAAGLQQQDLLPALPRISAPTLLIHGDDDFQCDPITQGERALAALPRARLEVVPNSGHRPWVEQPESFDAACTAWFRSISG